MSILRMIYLLLAILGTLLPVYHFGLWFFENGLSLSPMLGAWKANAATTGLYFDLVISAVALSVWILAETYVRRNWIALVAIPATFAIGLSCGLPLYLFLRTRPID